jgi:cell division ATPase FtsA
MFFFQSKKPMSRFIGVDLGHNSIKAAEYEFDLESKNIHVNEVRTTFLKNKIYTPGVISNVEDLVKNTLETILEVKSLVHEEEPDGLVVGISGYGILDRVEKLLYRREKEEKSINKKERSLIMEEIGLQLAKSTPPKSSLPRTELIQSSIVSMNIDDQKVEDLVDCKGRDIEFEGITTYGSYTYNAFLEELAKRSEIPLLGVFSNNFAVSQLVGYQYPDEKVSMILVEIGAYSTNVTLLKNNFISQVVSFAMGGKMFTDRLVNELGVSLEEAEDLKINYSKARLNKQDSYRIADFLRSDINLWVNALVASLEELSEGGETLPEYIVLYGGSSVLIGLKEALDFGNWYKELAFETKPSVAIFIPKNISYVIDGTDKMAHESRYINLLGLMQLSTNFSKDREDYYNISEI